MKRNGILLMLAMLLAVIATPAALADRGHRHHRHGHSHFGVFIGAPLGWYGYDPWPYRYWNYPYAYPPVITVPATPPVYIEREPAQAETAPQQPYYWYHCQQPEGYYPYVKECPGGWQKIVPPAAPPS